MQYKIGTWRWTLPQLPPENCMGLTFYRSTRDDGMEAPDIHVAKITKRHVFMESGLRLNTSDVPFPGIEWYSEMVVSPPMFC